MLQTYVSGVSDVLEICCKLFCIGVAKVDRDVAKVEWDVAHVAMTIHICFKCMFQIFHLYETYVANIFHLYVAKVDPDIAYAYML
jgi:hypothetical protein